MIKLNRIGVIFYFLVLSTACSATDNCAVQAERFLAKPTEANLDGLLKAMPTGECKSFFSIPEKHNALLNGASSGDKQFLAVLINGLPYMDGGHLGDSYRVLGETFVSDPVYLLEALSNDSLDEKSLASSLTALPLDTVDNYPKKLAVVDARLEALAKATSNRADLTEFAALASAELNKYREELKAIIAE